MISVFGTTVDSVARPSAAVRPTLRRRRRRACVRLGTVGMILAGLTGSAWGQPRPRPQQRPRRATARALTPREMQRPSVVIEPTAPIANLLVRSEEGLLRNDWKFAIDCLQRIIDDPGDSLVPRPGTSGDTILYESARRNATRRLAELPPEGLRAYRLLFDGKAKRLFELGKSTNDRSLLRAAVVRYLMTSYGDDATDALASMALDAGRATEALGLLRDLQELVPDADVPESLITMKLAAALAMLGRHDQAVSVMEASAVPGATDRRLADQANREALAVLTPQHLAPNDTSTRWLMPGGSADRRGHMSGAEPTLVDEVPWRFALEEGGAADAWRRVFSMELGGPLWLPVTQPTAQHGHLFVRTPRGCTALHVDDLSMAWAAGEPDRTPTLSRFSLDRRTSMSLKEAHQQAVIFAYNDYVAGGLALGHDLALTISRSGRAEYGHAARDLSEEDRPTARPVPPGSLVARVGGRALADTITRMIAYDLQSGAIRWQRGRTGDPSDPLGIVAFQSVPLAVGPYLWVSYQRQSDFYVAVLDPADGALVRQILLGSIGNAALAADGALPLASAEGLVYVPSGRGVLYAIDANDFTVRWANHFAFSQGGEQDSLAAGSDSWLPCAPVVAGGLVLLAARETHDLLAFEAHNGKQAWSIPGGDWSYVIAVDHQRVWLGGQSVACLSLSDTSAAWLLDLPAPATGQAVRCGDTIHVPVLDGLISIHAITGEALAYETSPAFDEPLGNLLCLDAAMFVVNPSGVRKYPDIDRSYARALEQHEANSGDPIAATRVGWLELLKGEPQRALDVLDAISASLLAADEHLTDRVAHVRVQSLLAMAREASTDEAASPDTLALLEQADRTAVRASDQLRCTLAIADQLAAVGRPVEAYQRLWEQALGDQAVQTTSFGERLEGPARFDLARRADRIRENLTDEERQALDAFRSAQTIPLVSELGRDGGDTTGLPRLAAIAEMESHNVYGQQAMLGLAAYHSRHVRYEQAERLLRDSVLTNADPVLSIMGLTHLCSLYARATSQGADLLGPLLGSLEELDSRFGASLLPSGVPQVRGQAQESTTLVTDWVTQFRSTTASARLAEYDTTNMPIGLTGETAWSFTWGAGDPRHLVRFSDGHPAALAQRVLLYDKNHALYCLDARDGELVWEAALKLPETFSEDVERDPGGPMTPLFAVADGQMAVFSAHDGLFAVGLATGRRIWVRPYELAGVPSVLSLRDRLMATCDGLLAAMPKAGRLTLLRLLDGETVWERDLRDEPVQRVWMTDDRIVTADERHERISILDRSDGTLIGQVTFEQPGEGSSVLNLVVTADTLCGPISTLEADEIVGINLQTGTPAWRQRLTKPPAQMFKLQEGFVGIGMFGGDVRVIDVKSGESLPNRHVSRTHKVLDGRLVDGTLVVRHSPSRGETQRQKLGAIDVATGEELWERDEVLSLAKIDDPLPIVGGCVPTILLPPRETRIGEPNRLTIIDIRTGENVGEEVAIEKIHGPGEVTDIELLPASGILIVGTSERLSAYSIKPVKPVEPTIEEGS